MLKPFHVLMYALQQIFGGAGYNQEYPVEKLMRDAKIYQVRNAAVITASCLPPTLCVDL